MGLLTNIYKVLYWNY